MIFNSSPNRLKIPTIFINSFIPSSHFFLISSTCFTYYFCFFPPCWSTLHSSIHVKSPFLKVFSFFPFSCFQPIFMGSILSCLFPIQCFLSFFLPLAVRKLSQSKYLLSSTIFFQSSPWQTLSFRPLILLCHQISLCNSLYYLIFFKKEEATLNHI